MDEDFFSPDYYDAYDDIDPNLEPDLEEENNIDIGNLVNVSFESIMQSIKSFCRVDCEVYNYIVKKEAEGKCKKSAKIAGLNKFLRQYYGILKKKYIELGTW